MKYLYNFIIPLLVCFGCDQPSTQEQDTSEDRTEGQESNINPEDLIGAWETSYTNEQGQDVTVVAIVTERYISAAAFNENERKFLSTSGGTWKLDGNKLHETYEFNTGDSLLVGETEVHTLKLNDGTLRVSATNTDWNRIDSGEPGALAGAWLITGRQRDGEVSRRTPGARKTMKILSGERFQWIAYNTETGDFFGTGGGTYTTEDSIYTENLKFFSRDSTKVGASLQFQYELQDDEWHHKGQSSKGDPIYEIWTKRSELEKDSIL